MKKDKASKKGKSDCLTEDDSYAVRQNSDYSDEGKAAPNNNIFFEGKSNPLSSKGN